MSGPISALANIFTSHCGAVFRRVARYHLVDAAPELLCRRFHTAIRTLPARQYTIAATVGEAHNAQSPDNRYEP